MACSAVLLRHVSITNVCSLLVDATHYHAKSLVDSLQEFMAVNMECLLESRLLDDMAPDLVKQLSNFVRNEQAKKLPISRSNILVDMLMVEHGEWLKLQDIPQPIPRSSKVILGNRPSPRLSPTAPVVMKQRRSPVIPIASSPSAPPPSGPTDDLFTMDDESIPPLSLDAKAEPHVFRSDVPQAQAVPVWKSKPVVPAK